MAQTYKQFPGLEFAVELTAKQVEKLSAKIAEAQADFEVTYEGKDLAKLLAMFIPALKGNITVAGLASTILAKMTAALSDKAIQAALSAAWAKVQAVTEKVTKAVTVTVEKSEDGGYFTFDDGKVSGYRLPLTINVNGKTVDREVRLPAELFTALAESTEAMNTAQTLFGAVTFKLDESLFPDRKTHRAWEVAQIGGVWQVVKAERAPSVVNGDKAPKGSAYEIVEGDKIVQSGILGQKAAFVAYAQKYPGSVNPETSLNLPKWSAGKIKAGKPFIRLVK